MGSLALTSDQGGTGPRGPSDPFLRKVELRLQPPAHDAWSEGETFSDWGWPKFSPCGLEQERAMGGGVLPQRGAERRAETRVHVLGMPAICCFRPGLGHPSHPSHVFPACICKTELCSVTCSQTVTTKSKPFSCPLVPPTTRCSPSPRSFPAHLDTGLLFHLALPSLSPLVRPLVEVLCSCHSPTPGSGHRHSLYSLRPPRGLLFSDA